MDRFEGFIEEDYVSDCSTRKEIDPDYVWGEDIPDFSIQQIADILRHIGETV